MSFDPLSEHYVLNLIRLDRYDPNAELTIDAQFHPDFERLAAQRPLAVPLPQIITELRYLEPVIGTATPRERALRSLIRGAVTRARVFAGEIETLRDEFELTFGLPAVWWDDSGVAKVNAQIADLIPVRFKTSGDLFTDYNAWLDSLRLGVLAQNEDNVHQLFDLVMTEARKRCIGIWGQEILPPPEDLHLKISIEKTPYKSGESKYRGAGVNDVEIIIDQNKPPVAAFFVHLVAHELCPGHSTEFFLKEKWALRQGFGEHLVVATYSPMVFLAEAIAENAREMIFPELYDLADFVIWLYNQFGVSVDRSEILAYLKAEELSNSLAMCRNNACLLKDAGVDQEEIWEYLKRTLMLPRQRFDSFMRFIERNRSYALVYALAKQLYGDWLKSQGDLEAQRAAFLRLLQKPLYPAELES